MIKKIATQPPKSTDQGQSQLPLSVDEGSGSGTLEKLREKAAHCQRCHLWETATQTVFGAGPADAGMMLVGEQPGDQEDLAGEPFVGPAGDVLDRALRDAGIDRAQVYVTNAVKHFKFEPRGKRRLHQKPDLSEIKACRWWLEEERRLDQAARHRRARSDRGAQRPGPRGQADGGARQTDCGREW